MNDTKRLPVSDAKQLDDGEDLALNALNQAQDDDIILETDDEVVKSDEIAETLTSLQNVIERNALNLEELSGKLKQFREQLKGVFDNDSELSGAEEQAKEVTTKVRTRKSQLMTDPTVVRLKNDIGELNEQKKEIEEALSNHLVNYYQLTNSKSIDTSDGDQREFVIRAKIKPAKRN